ncbi:MAG: RluA family pseudouridine synthase [Planctomycetes bacterium]|nr:RluA family pseudouridine synthase [Planctomycetota bacterium]
MPELYSLHRLTVAAPGEALFAALSAAIAGLSRHQARQAVSAGLVKVGGARVLEPKHVLGATAAVECDLRHGIKKPFLAKVHDDVGPAEKPFTILYEDSSLVVVDKAAGIISAPTQSGERGHVPELLRRAMRKRGRDIHHIGVVHRLDKDTSGCLCFALTRTAQRLIAAQFAAHSAGRVYRCIVGGQPRKDADTLSGRIAHGKFGRRVLLRDEPHADDEDMRDDEQDDERDDEDEREEDDDGDDRGDDRRSRHRSPGDAVRGKESITHFKVLRRFQRDSELEVTLETGRTHQIRVTLAAIGCPVLGDRVYGFRGADRRIRPGDKPPPRPPRLMLHAHRLSLDHPLTGERLTVEAPVPAVFVEFVRQLM